MSRSRFQLGWKVPATGYRWIQAVQENEKRKSLQPALVEAAQIDTEAVEGDAFEPEPHPVLFRLFAEVPQGQDGILDFATRYGNLGTETKLFSEGGTKATLPDVLRGTFLDIWRAQISSMRRLCGLWDLIYHEDTAALAAHIRWKDSPDGPCVSFDSHPEISGQHAHPLGESPVRELIASVASEPALMESHRTSDVVLPAKLYLQVQLDLHLHHASDEVKVSMVWDARREQPVLGYWCPTLVSAVWLQFATVVNENLAYGRCRECGKWFEVAPKAARASRRFCSTACRSKAYRERQDRARRMFAEKKRIEQIAEELDSDAATVRRWITGFKE